MPVYALTVDRSGLKMKPDTSGEELKNPIVPDRKTGAMVGTRVPLSYLCWWLTQQTTRDGRPVIDKTGLTGFYDFKLYFLPDLSPGYDLSKLPPGMADFPSLFTGSRNSLVSGSKRKKGQSRST